MPALTGDHSKGYVWAVYPGYDIFAVKDDGSDLKRLTEAPGYDAEATINAKTKRIVYTSLASGDLELWEMNLDGSGKEANHEDVRLRWRPGLLARWQKR